MLHISFLFVAHYHVFVYRIMPWYKTDDIHLQWNEWENNP